jgi:nucleosome binding factor SPN SPT16 subunit
MKVWSKGRGLSDVRAFIECLAMWCSFGFVKVDWASTEFCYSPIIQSRSTSTGYDLRSTAESSTDPIAHKGVFIIAVGMRYKAYCANLGRSIIVDPSKVSTCADPTLDSPQFFNRNKKRSITSWFRYSPR